MISICIITRNEEKNIKKCLEKLSKLNYQIVVIDTGSTDDTKKIASEYTNAIYDFEWCDDFSKARNFAISKANNSYILMVDSDEFIIHADKEELEKEIMKHPSGVGRVTIINQIGSQTGMEEISRLFPKELYCYSGRIHEQLTNKYGEKSDTYRLPVSFEHIGYNGNEEEKELKAKRNIYLLEKTIEEDDESAYILFQLGKSYYLMKEYNTAEKYLGKALEYDLNPKSEYVKDLVETYGYTLLNIGKLDKALMMENIYDEFSDSADFVFLMGHIYMKNAKFEQALNQFLNASKYKKSKVKGVTSFLAYYNIGVIFECLGEKEKAIEYYLMCKEYTLAVEGLKRLINK